MATLYMKLLLLSIARPLYIQCVRACYVLLVSHNINCNAIQQRENIGNVSSRARELLKAKCEFMCEQIIVDRRHLIFVMYVCLRFGDLTLTFVLLFRFKHEAECV